MFVVLNPIQLFGGGIQNIGALNDFFFYLIIYLMQAAARSGLSSTTAALLGYAATTVAAIATYFDPRVIFIVFPLCVL